MARVELPRIINAAGHLSLLGGALSPQALAAEISAAIAEAMTRPIDVASLKDEASRRISAATGAGAGCVTTGAAAGVALSVAACITGDALDRVHALHARASGGRIVLQAGHDIDFGAPIVQMVRLGGGSPELVGTAERTSEDDLRAALDGASALLFVQSHHVAKADRVSLQRCLTLAHEVAVPVIVDAAAEEDLRAYIALGVDLAVYSGGKALGGLSSSGFVAGREDLVRAVRAHERGIGRAMKVGPEQLLSICLALEDYDSRAQEASSAVLAALSAGVTAMAGGEFSVVSDEAGRHIERLEVRTPHAEEVCRALRGSTPAIYVRAHHAREGRFAIDPRNVALADVPVVLAALRRALKTHSVE
jgi:D-glucosaminate-6-phosphate ammonia-lyase